MAGDAAENKKKRGVIVAVILVVCLIAGIVGGLFLSKSFGTISDASNQNSVQPAIPDQESDTAHNPIDFSALQKQNPDIFAWIYVPGTDVNYPVVQHPSNNAYYLTHSVDGEQVATGAVYAELCNTTDFSNSCTILYGHNSTDGTMFSTLHDFEKKSFFDEHDTICVYAPGRVLTYRIASSYVTTDEHLMHRYNFFSSKKNVRQFEKDIKDPDSVSANVRDGVKMDDDSRFLVLSTCNSTALGERNRYLVVGMLVNDQPSD